MKQVKVAGCVFLFKCRHVMNADILSQSTGETKDSVINIPWLHLLASIMWSLLTFNKYKYTQVQTHTNYPPILLLGLKS